MTYSFDVFDTCLTRKFAAPSDLFFELGRRLQQPLAGRFDAETLRAARLEAERAARQSIAREEVTLAEIWQEFSARLDAPELLAFSRVELELEAESLFPIADSLREISELRAEGARVLFISDTYLPASFVSAQLYKHGLGRLDDGLYVSSQWGKTKAAGSLFEVVFAEESLLPGDLCHRGDDPLTDVARPRLLGVQCRPVRYRTSVDEQTSLLHAESPDYPTRSRLVGAMQVERLGQTAAAAEQDAALLAGLVGPLILGFASWVLAQAQRDGIRRLYFLSRDCQMTAQAAAELAHRFGGIECRYLRVSRQALLLPTATALSDAGMPWMRRTYETPSLERLLAKLELDYADVSADWSARAGTAGGKFKLQHDDDWQLFWQSLNREPVRGSLLARIEERRVAAQAYFREEGLFDAVPWAVVDLGWYLSCQRALRALLNLGGTNIECRGYYLGLRRERFRPGEAGPATALFYQRGADQARKQPLFQHATLFEHVLGMADHPSVHHYAREDGTARPVAQSLWEAASPLEVTRAIHARVRDFAAQNAALAPELGETQTAAPILSSLIESLALRPSAGVARALSTLRASEDQNNFQASSLAAPLRWREVASLWLPKRLRRICGRAIDAPLWMQGRLAATTPLLRRLVALRRLASQLKTTA